MQCPTCLEELPRRFWRPSQWNRYSPVTDEYVQCKICDGEFPHPEWYSSNRSTNSRSNKRSRTSSSQSESRAPTVRPMPETGLDHVPKEALELIELLIDFRSDVASKFVYKWMELPRRVRKEYSYNGAIRCRGSSDPKHYYCPIEKQDYFDPSNWVYAVTMRLMVPKMMQEVEWNNETKGDIFESILGCHYLVANGFVSDDVVSFNKNIGIVNAIFEEFVWHTWRLCDAIGKNKTEQVLQWVTWIIDVVAHRQMRDDDVGTIVLHEIPAEFEFDPRCKCPGKLIPACLH